MGAEKADQSTFDYQRIQEEKSKAEWSSVNEEQYLHSFQWLNTFKTNFTKSILSQLVLANFQVFKISNSVYKIGYKSAFLCASSRTSHGVN